MSGYESDASKLIYKALHINLSPVNDLEYRALLGRYREEVDFARAVSDIAGGLELMILDFSERGLILAPRRRDTRFSLRLSDLRQNLSSESKVALAMAHLAISAVFFPTNDWIDDDSRIPLPATVSRFRDALLAVTNRLADSVETSADSQDLSLGWQYLKRLPAAIPNAERASTNSIEGFIKLALRQMLEFGLVQRVRESEDETQEVYTPTYRLRVQLREHTLPQLFEIARASVSA